MKEKLRNELTKYDYKFKESENQIIIDLGSWQEVKVTFENEQIKISDKLRAWNILSTFPMSIKTALYWNPVYVIIFAAIFYKFENSFFYIGLLIAINILIVTFSIKYLIKLEGLKTKIAIWLNDSNPKLL